MEVNYTDALLFSKDAELGTGKIYYPDGSLRYEWKLTNMDDKRYKKAYHRNGQLHEETYYNNMGETIKRVVY